MIKFFPPKGKKKKIKAGAEKTKMILLVLPAFQGTLDFKRFRSYSR